MEYKSLNQIGSEIVESCNNNFIYENNFLKRAELLKELETLYPILAGKDRPMAIYVDDFRLPIIDAKSQKSLEKVELISDNYISFTILSNLIRKTIKDIDESKISFNEILDFFNKSVLVKGKVETMDSLLEVVEDSRSFYSNYYENYMLDKYQSKSIEDLKIDFIELRFILKEYKKFIRNNSYFTFILDKHGPMPMGETIAINYMIGARSNLDYSISVGTEDNGWDNYRIGDGQPIEAMHDYEVISLKKRNSKII